MLRSTASKVMWVGRATVFLVGLAVTLALVFGVASMAMGANGGNLILGSLNNAATAVTKLTGNVSGGPALQVQNTNTQAGSKALQLGVAPGKAPLTVNATAGKAQNLNADKIDGQEAAAFLGKTEKAADAAHADQADSATNAQNADKLDGKDSSAFGIKTDHATKYTDECDSPLNTLNECAPVTVTVPAGKTYLVSVWSSFSAKQTATGNQLLAYCPTQRNPGQTTPSCISPFGYYNFLTLRSGEHVGGASSGETLPLSAGTYTFSTGTVFQQDLNSTNYGQAITKVMVRDAAGAAVSSAAIETQDAPR